MRLCKDCKHPTTRGSSYRGACERCLVCETERIMRAFSYPASHEGQRALRKKKARQG